LINLFITSCETYKIFSTDLKRSIQSAFNPKKIKHVISWFYHKKYLKKCAAVLFINVYL